MPWVVDGLNASESVAVRELLYGAAADILVVSSIVDLDWVQDGIEDLEATTIWRLSNVAWKDAGIASSVVGFSWIKDGINEVEYQTIDELRFFNFDDLRLVSSVVALDWVQDGIESAEADAIDSLNRFSDEDAALQILSMPFLVTLEPHDAVALQALSRMQMHRVELFSRIMSHPTLSNGITDEWAPVVATLNGVSATNPQLINTLLDPDKVDLEQRVIELPLAGKTLLAIIRTSPGSEQSMDLLEHAVRHAEAYMDTSFPTGYVGWLFAEQAVEGFAGANYGTHIASAPTVDVYHAHESGYSTGHHIAHEVAHYYWRAQEIWLHEGMADFMGTISENSRTGKPVEAKQSPCGYARSIAELKALGVTREEGIYSPYLCNYQLGERLFLDLHRNLGEESFQEGLKKLYLLSQDQAQRGTKLGIEHVRSAFKTDGNDSLVDTVVARWYDGTQPYAIPEETTTRPNADFLTIDGRLIEAYLAETRWGTPITSISAEDGDDWLWVRLRWTHNADSVTEVPLELVGYYEDGFEFEGQKLTLIADPIERSRSVFGWYQTGLSPSAPWAQGQYQVRIYNEGRLLARLEYEVTE